MSERLSMRQASKELGVSQIRVRELIRKGTLEAEKIVEDGSERWAIGSASVRAFLDRRDDESPSGAATPPRRPADLRELLAGLEAQVGRIGALISEIESARSSLDALRAAQRSLEREIGNLKEAAPDAKAPKAEEPKTDEPKAEKPKAEKPKAEKPKAEKPKAEEPKAEKPKAEEPNAEEPKAEEPKAKKPKADKPKAEGTKTEQPSLDASPAVEESAGDGGEAPGKPAGSSERKKDSPTKKSSKGGGGSAKGGSGGGKPAKASHGDNLMAAALKDAGLAQEGSTKPKGTKRPRRKKSEGSS